MQKKMKTLLIEKIIKLKPQDYRRNIRREKEKREEKSQIKKSGGMDHNQFTKKTEEFSSSLHADLSLEDELLR